MSRSNLDPRIDWTLRRGGAILCGPNEINRLGDLLSSEIGSVSWSIECADNSTLKGNCLNDLLQFENSKERRILCVSLRSSDIDRGRSSNIRLGKDYDTIEISVGGPAEFVDLFRVKLQREISGLYPWYRFLGHTSFSLQFLSVLTVLLIAAGQIIFWSRLMFSKIDLQSESISTASVVSIIHGIIGIFLVSFLLNSLRKILFPSMVCTIGQGRQMYDTLKWVQRLVVAAVVGASIPLLKWLL